VHDARPKADLLILKKLGTSTPIQKIANVASPFTETSKRSQNLKECFNRPNFRNSVTSALELSKIELVTNIVHGSGHEL